MTPKPRLFRARRQGTTLYLGREPLEAVQTWVEQNRSRIRPRTVTNVVVAHDHDCRYPQGGPCTCRTGPTITLATDRPSEN